MPSIEPRKQEPVTSKSKKGVEPNPMANENDSSPQKIKETDFIAVKSSYHIDIYDHQVGFIAEAKCFGLSQSGKTDEEATNLLKSMIDAFFCSNLSRHRVLESLSLLKVQYHLDGRTLHVTEKGAWKRIKCEQNITNKAKS